MRILKIIIIVFILVIILYFSYMKLLYKKKEEDIVLIKQSDAVNIDTSANSVFNSDGSINFSKLKEQR